MRSAIRKKPLLTGLVTVLMVIIGAGIFYMQRQNSSTDENVTVSSLYEQVEVPPGQLKELAGNLAFYSSFRSALDGNDVCYVLDKNSRQIYAKWLYAGGFNVNSATYSENGTTYYKNDTVGQKEALQLLHTNCERAK